MNDIKKILAVDDDQFILDIIDAALDKRSFALYKCSSPADAYALISQGSFDAIISDVNMPEEDGLSFIKALHAQDVKTPILMISGESFTSKDKQRDLNAICFYADEVLGKPFTKDELLDALDTIT
mgnify:CR=1 FL=1